MFEPDHHVFAVYVTEALVSFLIAGTLGRFALAFRRAYIGDWACSWAALGAYLACGAVMLVSSSAGGSSALWLSALALTVGLWQGAFLVFGALDLEREGCVSRRLRISVLLATGLCSLAIAAATLDSSATVRVVAQVGTRTLVVAAAFAFAALRVWRHQVAPPRFGERLTAIAFGFYALDQINFYLAMSSKLAPWSRSDFVLYLGLFDLVLLLFIGVGFVIWQLEKERARIAEAAEAARRSEERSRRSQQLDLVGRLAGGIAHDFNNLLTGVIGYAELLKDSLSVTSPQHGYADRIAQSAERASQLTAQLLAFGRRQPSQPRALDLNHEIRKLEVVLQRLVGASVRFELALDPTLVPVEADPSQFEQVLFNLALNARDALRPGGRLEIRTATDELDEARAAELGGSPGTFARIDVIDDGVGMDEDTKSHLFEPFFTTKPVGKGSGLGLSTAYGIVRHSGGWVSIDSHIGSGTRVTLWLPACDRELVPASPPQHEPHSLGGDETILLVEDEPEILELLGDALEASGYRVLRARDASQALALSQSHSPLIHVLVTDIVMPGTSGAELARRLCESRAELRVVFISAHPVNELDFEGEFATPSRWLQKPFSAPILMRAIRELLEGSGRWRARPTRAQSSQA